ncbi:MAG: hypothetical protein WC464_00335 [Bdellovibrionales bacterium]
MNLNMLDDIPDPEGLSFDKLTGWLNERIDVIRKTPFTPEIAKTFTSVEFKDTSDHPLGIEASSAWRRFFLATLLADWASYDKPVDRADYARLKYIMTSAYRYTRLWGCRLPDGKFTPLGYTAWYPVAKFVFEGVLNNSADVDDRGIILPLRNATPENTRYGYVFNISIAKELFNTPYSQRLGLAFKSDLENLPKLGFLAITVDPDDAQRLCSLGNFVHTGDVLIQGAREALYVRRPLLG